MSHRIASDDLMALARALPKDRDATLLRATTALFCQDPIHDRDAVRRYEELAIHFLSRATADDRAYVASLLAARADAPPAVMRLLARDRIHIAAPVLRQSPVLSTIDLLGVIAVTGPDHHRLIASRPALNADVLRALALARSNRKDGPYTVAELIESPVAPALPDDAAPAAASRTDIEHLLEGGVGGFLDLPPERRVRLIADLAARRPPPRLSMPRRLDNALRRAFANAEIVAAAKASDRPRLVAGFTNSIGLESATIERLLADPSGEPLVLMIRAAGFKEADGRIVLLLANREVSQSVARFFHLADLLACLEPAVAENFVASWRAPVGVRAARHIPVMADTMRPRSAMAAPAAKETLPERKSEAV